MSVCIQFDKPNEWLYTNLDFVAGKVILSLPTDQSIAAINVKLEGESRTRLAGPKNPYNERSDKTRVELELHKLLYKVITIFPSAEIRSQSPTSSGYTLAAGTYQYPFHVKFPLNNNCPDNPSTLRDLKLGSLSVQLAPDVRKHIKRTLPPSIRGFPGEAEVKYFVKATVVRPKFYQENLRTQVDIKFLPIEPPRKPLRHEETFARRKHQFLTSLPQPSKGLKLRRSIVPAPVIAQDAPMLQVDARLPNPAILTCNEPLPLRLMVQKLNNAPGTVRVTSLQIKLLGYTHVRAQDLTRTESSNWTLFTSANMNLAMGNTAADQKSKDWIIPPRFWDNKPLPNTVAPSFETCNLSRTYELEIQVGLQPCVARMDSPGTVVLPLRVPVKVYSGIVPPPALLSAMATGAKESPFHSVTQAASSTPGVQDIDMTMPAPPVTPDPEQSEFPAQIGSYMPYPSSDDSEVAPPSYEDAIADDIGPVDGPRRQYTMSEDPVQSSDAFIGDSKRSGLRRQLSERLFSQNATASPRRSIFGSPSAFHQANVVEEETWEDDLSKVTLTPTRSPTESRNPD